MYIMRYFPANIIGWSKVGLMLAQRLRRWSNIKSILGESLVLAGIVIHHPGVPWFTVPSCGNTMRIYPGPRQFKAVDFAYPWNDNYWSRQPHASCQSLLMQMTVCNRGLLQARKNTPSGLRDCYWCFIVMSALTLSKIITTIVIFNLFY